MVYGLIAPFNSKNPLYINNSRTVNIPVLLTLLWYINDLPYDLITNYNRLWYLLLYLSI